MVEYALLLASTSVRGLAGEVGAWASTVNWHALGYALLALVALRIAFRAFRSLGILRGEPVAGLTVHLIPHTHWDREWYLPRAAFVARLVPAIDDLLDRLDADPDFRSFFLDGQTVLLEDYLRVRPEQRARVAALRARRPASGRPLVRPGRRADPLGRVASSGTCCSAGPTPNGSAGGRTCCTPPMRSVIPRSGPRSPPSSASPYGVLWRGLGGEPGQEGDLYRWHAPDGRVDPAAPPAARRLRGRAPAWWPIPRPLAESWARLRPVLAGRAATPQLAVPVGADHHAAPVGDRPRARSARRGSSRKPRCGSRGWTSSSARRPPRPTAFPRCTASCAGPTATPGRCRACTPPARRSSAGTPRPSCCSSAMAEPLAALPAPGGDRRAAAATTPGARWCARSFTTRSAAAPRTRWRGGWPAGSTTSRRPRARSPAPASTP